jgi:hypothetical protein
MHPVGSEYAQMDITGEGFKERSPAMLFNFIGENATDTGTTWELLFTEGVYFKTEGGDNEDENPERVNGIQPDGIRDFSWTQTQTAIDHTHTLKAKNASNPISVSGNTNGTNNNHYHTLEEALDGNAAEVSHNHTGNISMAPNQGVVSEPSRTSRGVGPVIQPVDGYYSYGEWVYGGTGNPPADTSTMEYRVLTPATPDGDGQWVYGPWSGTISGVPPYEDGWDYEVLTSGEGHYEATGSWESTGEVATVPSNDANYEYRVDSTNHTWSDWSYYGIYATVPNNTGNDEYRKALIEPEVYSEWNPKDKNTWTNWSSLEGAVAAPWGVVNINGVDKQIIGYADYGKCKFRATDGLYGPECPWGAEGGYYVEIRSQGYSSTNWKYLLIAAIPHDTNTEEYESEDVYYKLNDGTTWKPYGNNACGIVLIRTRSFLGYKIEKRTKSITGYIVSRRTRTWVPGTGSGTYKRRTKTWVLGGTPGTYERRTKTWHPPVAGSGSIDVVSSMNTSFATFSVNTTGISLGGTGSHSHTISIPTSGSSNENGHTHTVLASGIADINVSGSTISGGTHSHTFNLNYSELKDISNQNTRIASETTVKNRKMRIWRRTA